MIYFLIHKSLVIPEIGSYVLYFEQTTLNNKLNTEVFSQLFYSGSRALFFENSCSNASELRLIFGHASMGHANFQNNEICISWEPHGLLQCFF